MVLDINAPDSILRAVCGEPVGTLISYKISIMPRMIEEVQDSPPKNG